MHSIERAAAAAAAAAARTAPFSSAIPISLAACPEQATIPLPILRRFYDTDRLHAATKRHFGR